MDRFDEILEHDLSEIRALAAERISLEQNQADEEVDAAEYFSHLDSLEMKFGRAMRSLQALLFDDPDETEEQARATEKELLDYFCRVMLRARPGTWTIAEVLPDGPYGGQNLDERRRRAARARVAKINKNES